jgi:hypothetical protein
MDIDRFYRALINGLIALSALITVAALQQPAHAAERPYRITHDMGGIIALYVERYRALEAVGGKVVIDGLCLSACTLVTALVPDGDVCTTDRGVFGFHSGTGPTGDFAREGTRIAWAMYPQRIQARLRALGWDGNGDKPHPDMIYVRATEFYPLCSEAA